MKSMLLIDQIMRQTTVLIAQISTAAGIRAPLSHVADDVFLNLSREIEGQGVSRKVAADMFGMALRGYQRKVQRLSESSTFRGKTLWEAILEHLEQHQRSSRTELLKRFMPDGDERVAAVLRDLRDSGLIFSMGRGESTLYGLTSTQDRASMLAKGDAAALPSLVWFSVYREAKSVAELAVELDVPVGDLRPVVDELASQGVIEAGGPAAQDEGRDGEQVDASSTLLKSRRFVVPVGSERGWEVAVFDHFRAVANAIASKLALQKHQSAKGDRVGGATLVFDISEQHPYAARVYGLLQGVRGQVNELWQEVSEYNQTHRPSDAELVRVTFYAGQNVESMKAGESQ